MFNYIFLNNQYYYIITVEGSILMKLIIAQPFGHRAGHYASETWQLADTLIEKQLNLAFVSFNGFINKSEHKIEESGFKHLCFTKNAGFIKKLMVLGLIRFFNSY